MALISTVVLASSSPVQLRVCTLVLFISDEAVHVCIIVALPPFTQEGKSALMLAVREDISRFRKSYPPRTRVVSQLVKAGATLDLQDEVHHNYLVCLRETDTVVIIASYMSVLPYY